MFFPGDIIYDDWAGPTKRARPQPGRKDGQLGWHMPRKNEGGALVVATLLPKNRGGDTWLLCLTQPNGQLGWFSVDSFTKRRQ